MNTVRVLTKRRISSYQTEEYNNKNKIIRKKYTRKNQ